MLIERLRTYIPYAWRFAALRSAGPFICGIAITDRCNLSCRGCHVSNTGMGDMPYDDVARATASPPTRAAAARRTSPAANRCSGATGTSRSRTSSSRRASSATSTCTSTRTARSGWTPRPTSCGSAWTACPSVYETRRGDHFAEVERNIRGAPPPQDRHHLRHRPLHAGRSRAVPSLGARVATAGHRRDDLLPHALLRQGRALPRLPRSALRSSTG